MTRKPGIPKASTNGLRSFLLHFIFFVSGLATVLIGQVLPYLERNLELNDLQLSYFFPSQFSGSLIGTVATRWFAQRGRLVFATFIGACLMAVGVLLLNVAEFYSVCGGFFVNGLGIGLTLPAINLLIMEANPDRTAAALSFLNFFWGAGAIVSKPFVDLTSQGGSLIVTTAAVAIGLFVAAIPLFSFRRREETESPPDIQPDVPADVSIWLSPVAWGITFFHFVHVGFESGVGGWITTYTDRVAGYPFTDVVSPTFLYFLFFVIGRAAAPIVLRVLSEEQMLWFSLVVVATGVFVIISAESITALGIGGSIAGWGTSAIFPTNLARFYSVFGAKGRDNSMPLFFMGTVGAAVVTWLVGFVSKTSGELQNGMLVLGGAVVILFFSQAVIASQRKRRNSIVRPHES